MPTFDKDTFTTEVLLAEQKGIVRLSDALDKPDVFGIRGSKSQCEGEKGKSNKTDDAIASSILPGMGYEPLTTSQYKTILAMEDKKKTHKLLHSNKFVRQPNGTQAAPDFYVFSDDGVRTSIEIKSVAKRSGPIMFNSGSIEEDILYCFIWPHACVVDYGRDIFPKEYIEAAKRRKVAIKKSMEGDEEWLGFMSKGYPDYGIRPALEGISANKWFIKPHLILYSDYISEQKDVKTEQRAVKASSSNRSKRLTQETKNTHSPISQDVIDLDGPVPIEYYR